MATHLISLRRPSGDPSREAFTDTTYELIGAMERDFERSVGKPFEGGNGILVANDVLLELHGEAADWSRFEVGELERWLCDNEPGFAKALPVILLDLMVFTNFIARRGILAPERAEATQARALTFVDELMPKAGGNRQQRRASRAEARRRARRLH